MNALAGTLIARIVSDDLYGDVPGRRLEIASALAELSQRQEPDAHLAKLWILNRFRNQDLLERYKDALGCVHAGAMDMRGERVAVYASRFDETHVIELPFRQTELDACPNEVLAHLYLANPNVARNAALAFGAASGAQRTFVLDGDIFVPPETWEQTSRLLQAYGADRPVWMFTMRAWSIDEFRVGFPADSHDLHVVDTCENEFVLNSWPPRVIRLGDEGMLGLPRGAACFDELREYGRDPKVAYCETLRASGFRLLTPSYPVCHLEHRMQPPLPDTLSASQREQQLLEHRIATRDAALKELLSWWRRGEPPNDERSI